jgi:hypothetical protein
MENAPIKGYSDGSIDAPQIAQARNFLFAERCPDADLTGVAKKEETRAWT